jgi:phage replication O-like protein O
MANPQRENGFTGIAHEILESIQMYKFSLNEIKIILCVFRFTYGFNRKEHEMSLSFFMKHTGLNRSRVNDSVRKLLEYNVLILAKKGNAKTSNSYAFNKDYDSWTIEKYSSFNDTSNKLNTSVQIDTSVQNDTSTSVQIDTSTSVQFDTQERNNKESIKENIYTIFEHWKSKGIIVHKKMNKQMESHINARLEDYEIGELLKAIDNYCEVLNNDRYYWTHRWTLQDFMKPNNVVRFLDSSKPFEAFSSKKIKTISQKQTDDNYYEERKVVSSVNGGLF